MAVDQSFSDGIVIFYVILVHSWFYVWHRVCMQWLQIGDDMEEAYTHSDLSGSSKDSASWHILRLTNQGAALDQGWRLLSVIPFWTSFSSGRDCVVVVTGKGMWILMIAWTLCSKPRNWTKWTRKTTCHCRQGQQCTYVFVMLQWQLDFLLFVLYTSNVLCLVVYVPIFSSKHVKVLRRMYSVVICCADFTVCWAFLTITILRTGLIQLCRWSTLLVRQIAYNKACLKTILSPESKILICCWSVIFSVDDNTVFV